MPSSRVLQRCSVCRQSCSGRTRTARASTSFATNLGGSIRLTTTGVRTDRSRAVSSRVCSTSTHQKRAALPVSRKVSNQTGRHTSTCQPSKATPCFFTICLKMAMWTTTHCMLESPWRKERSGLAQCGSGTPMCRGEMNLTTKSSGTTVQTKMCTRACLPGGNLNRARGLVRMQCHHLQPRPHMETSRPLPHPRTPSCNLNFLFFKFFF
mmetsp:Transcript_6005/g.9306  ORF Transcript_6005/g.9306 Transcript_6005/m.9306 type:complete len:209 (+) Transcript_6005:353-979(+)